VTNILRKICHKDKHNITIQMLQAHYQKKIRSNLYENGSYLKDLRNIHHTSGNRINLQKNLVSTEPLLC